jgi:gluconokinase
LEAVDAKSIFIVMGVSGSGKSTVAAALAKATHSLFLDADDFHLPEIKAKLSSGTPLIDEDRWPWLERLNAELRGHGQAIFLACSALKQKYRDLLVAGLPEARIVYLKGSRDLIASRLAHRKGHFMPASLLDSQFATLEEPKDALVLDISRTEEQMVEDFVRLA